LGGYSALNMSKKRVRKVDEKNQSFIESKLDDSSLVLKTMQDHEASKRLPPHLLSPTLSERK
jgi:hypothetical protein